MQNILRKKFTRNVRLLMTEFLPAPSSRTWDTTAVVLQNLLGLSFWGHTQHHDNWVGPRDPKEGLGYNTPSQRKKQFSAQSNEEPTHRPALGFEEKTWGWACPAPQLDGQMGHCDNEEMYSVVWKKERQTEWFISWGQRHVKKQKKKKSLQKWLAWLPFSSWSYLDLGCWSGRCLGSWT